MENSLEDMWASAADKVNGLQQVWDFWDTEFSQSYILYSIRHTVLRLGQH